MREIAVIILSTLTFISCENGPIAYSVPFKENACIKEVYKQYADPERRPSSIYKLNKKVEESRLKVSVWHNHAWYYQGVKNNTYFKNSKLFDYVGVDCPDGSDKKVGITDRLKSIDL